MSPVNMEPQKLPLPQYQNGMVRPAAVDETIAPKDSVAFSMNLNFDRIGAVQRRPGTTLLGAQITDNTPITGMGFFRNNAGSIFAVLAKVGATVYAYTGSSWASVRTSLTASGKARFTNLVDYVFMVNGRGNEVCSTWPGSSSFGSTNVASLPKGDFIENYRSRIWIADSLTDKVYYSDVVTTSQTITGGTSYIQISPADGERIRGLKRHPRALLVFKENHIYRIFSTNSTDPDPSIFRGTYSQESIIEAKDGIYYHHPTGFYKFVFDGEQEEISRPILDIVNAIPRSSYSEIAGWADDDHIYWSIGDIVLDGTTLTNIVVRRTISTQVWTVYSYPTQIVASTLYDDGSTGVIPLVGDDDGNVLKTNTGLTDNGSPVFYDLTTHWLYLSESKGLKKSLSQILTVHENAQGCQIQYQLDSDNQKNTANAWKSMGQISKDLVDIHSCNAVNFTRIRFRLTGSSSGTPFIFRGFELLDLIIKGVEK
jgi:hypothetical protein